MSCEFNAIVHKFPNSENLYFDAGMGPSKPAPKLIGNLIAFLLNLVSIVFKSAILVPEAENDLHSDLVLFVQIGPKGLEFARYSLDYHTIRNYLYTNRSWGKERYLLMIRASDCLTTKNEIMTK